MSKTKREYKQKAAQPDKSTPARPRKLQAPKRVWFKPKTWKNHPLVPNYAPLPKARIIFVTAFRQIWQYKRLFAGIVAIYGVFNLLLVRGLAGSTDLSSIKGSLDGAFSGITGKLAESLTSFTYLLASSGSGSTATSGVYQSMLFILCSLAFIWALRQVLAKHQVRIRDSFYQGMYPLIPFLLMFALIGLQLIPLALGGGLYSLVTANGIAVHLWEKAMFICIFIILGLWSLRMVTASIFAMYIATLPDMTPLRAYRSAKQLVYGRRLLIWRKLIFLPVVLLILAALIELPLILFLTPVAVWMFFVLSMVTLPVAHGYLYNLYREML